jgi:superfamily II DNA helicase RecQ
MSKPRQHTMPDDNEQLQREVEERTGIRPCIWQIEVVCMVLEGVDVMTIAATGSGKSLCYWMALLYVKNGIVFLVTPLKLLGKQFVETLERNELRAVSITAANATNELFEVRGPQCCKVIKTYSNCHGRK